MVAVLYFHFQSGSALSFLRKKRKANPKDTVHRKAENKLPHQTIPVISDIPSS